MASLIDSNIIIYSYLNEYQYLREMIIDGTSNISEISRIEILGYHGLKNDEESYFNDIFTLVNIIIPTQEIFDRAISIRKQYNLKLGDSLIAATAIVSNLTLYTKNIRDFEKITGLKSINPVSK
jgi:predicted nucleic acid-binding protein